jgi:hypothetical protein
LLAAEEKIAKSRSAALARGGRSVRIPMRVASACGGLEDLAELLAIA